MEEAPTTSSSQPKKILDGNWMRKRKRKRRPDLSRIKSGASVESTAKDNPLNGKGNERHYECEECSLGGDLLFCDSCPQMYHLECLKPPLKVAPRGKWRCPSCRGHRNSCETPNRLHSLAKRARSKIHIDSGRILRSAKSSNHGKSMGTIKGGNMDETSTQGSESRGVVSPENLDDDECEKSISTRSVTSKKRDSGISFFISLDQPIQKPRRRRPIPGEGGDMRSDMPRARYKPGSSAASDNPSSVTNSEGILQRLCETTPTTEKKNVAEKAPGHDPGSQEVQQVHRILGCRVHGTDRTSSFIELNKTSSKLMHEELEHDKSSDSTNRLISEKDIKACDLLPKQVIAEQIMSMGDNKVIEDDNYENSGARSTVNLGDSSGVSYEYLVKWVGSSNIHNSWIPEAQLKALAKRKLDNYKAKYGTTIINICQEQWIQPQRVIDVRESKDGTKEGFIKWRGLPYDECTWERFEEPVIKNSSRLISEFYQFESQALEQGKTDPERFNDDDKEVSPLLEQPKELRGLLFPHQLEALNWLRKCWHKSKNVILADEMGLGKTVSACAFISSLYCEFKAKLPCLVLVPLSTMPNWLSEFYLWAPHLNVVEYHGGAKARMTIRNHEWHPCDANGRRLTSLYKFNVLLTTYEMVLADASHLRGISWEVLVVDEGHRLKNSESKLFSLLNTLSFQHRVLLTGTPLQNNIGEMYNLLNFLQPATFSSLSAFEEKFNDLTTTEKVEELKKLVSPHMLRRLKKDAMQNIPPKTERMAPVELTSIQAEYYRAMLTKNYQILRNIGKGIAQQSMLNIVMQLRKVCNHPYLIPGTEPETGSEEFLQEMRIKASGKLTLLHSMLKILHKEGHRVLIFSQMTKLLDILEDYLTVEYGSMSFERVDGSVSVEDRQAAIARFNHDKSRFVFLLSTRSCGLGINLATADTVIIYDSDFNPHADIQAMNRAHRIGQSNRLLVYRLVVRASVEERILQLAKKKLMLDQLFVNKSETQKEVEDILRWGTEELFKEPDRNELCNSRSDGVMDGESKSRRRSRGLGNVYQDRCMDVGKKIVWDESAILKLLDRSDLQASTTEMADSEMENDMLGAVKSMEWIDDTIDEQVACNISVENSGAKDDDRISNTEVNEWDRLLRVRWEMYQNEEEASLGRGKRRRKAISYKEAFAQIPSEASSESGNEEEEPAPEYTPAGMAFKAKFSKLRTRQKERIARRNIPETSASKEAFKDADERVPDEVQMPNHVKASESSFNKIPSEVFDDGSSSMTFKTQKPESVGPSSLENLYFPLSSGLPNLVPKEGKSQKGCTFLGLPVPNFDERGEPSEVQFPPFKDLPARIAPQPLLSDNLFMEIFNRHLNRTAPGGGSHLNMGKAPLGRIDETPLPFFQERSSASGMDQSLPHFPSPYFLGSKSLSDILPSISLDKIKPENLQDSLPVPPFPSFNSRLCHVSGNQSTKHNYQLPELPLLSQLLPPLLPPFSDNHRKERTMTEAGPSGSKTGPKKRPKMEPWTEDELDLLWIGVRRHGRGNWEAMLRDPKLKLLKHRSPEELSTRWASEQARITKEPAASSALPPLPDGFISRALAHVTDIRLGGGRAEGPLLFPLKKGVDLGAPAQVEPDKALTSEKSNLLPHWLREAVNAPSLSKPAAAKPQPLPPAVAAIGKAVRALYGGKESVIPAFTVPNQQPALPKEPANPPTISHIPASGSLDLNLANPSEQPPGIEGHGKEEREIDLEGGRERDREREERSPGGSPRVEE